MIRIFSIILVFLAGLQFGGRGLFGAIIVIGLLLGEQMRGSR